MVRPQLFVFFLPLFLIGDAMETVVNFIGKVSDMVKKSLKETKSCIGKEVVDTSAGKKGICIDRITNFFGTKISFMGVKYEKSEISQIEKLEEDILVCQGKDKKFFIPMSDVSAVGSSIILLKTELKTPEIEETSQQKKNVLKRFYLTREAIKDILPDAVPPSEEKETGKWLRKLIGE